MAMAITTKTQQVVKMTTLSIKDNLDRKVFKQSSFKVSFRNSISNFKSLKCCVCVCVNPLILKHRPKNIFAISFC